MSIKTKTLKIYNNGHLDYIATYRPLIRDNALHLLDHVDFFFVNGHWPRDGEL